MGVVAAQTPPAAAPPAIQVSSSDPVAAAQAALLQALAQAPMSLPVAVFVKDRAAGYGMYELREGGSRFKSGEAMYVYVEPLAYKYKTAGADVTFGLTMDFTVLSKDGNILGGKEKFLDVSFRSHRHNTEIMLNATITIQSAPPGDYQLELTVHDQSSPDVAHARLAIHHRIGDRPCPTCPAVPRLPLPPRSGRSWPRLGSPARRPAPRFASSRRQT